MALSPGTRLSDQYEVVAPLGAGGMGEVYGHGTSGWAVTSPSRCSPKR